MPSARRPPLPGAGFPGFPLGPPARRAPGSLLRRALRGHFRARASPRVGQPGAREAPNARRLADTWLRVRPEKLGSAQNRLLGWCRAHLR